MKSVKSVIRLRDKSGRTRQLSVDEALAEASRILSAGEYGNALLILEKAVRAAPFSARARQLLGESQALSGNLTEAVYNLRKAVDAEPKNAACRGSLAQALMPLNPTEAIPHFLSAMALGSTSVYVFGYLASILLDLNREEDALKVCDLGQTACPDQSVVLGVRTVVLRRLRRYEEALACCVRQRELQPVDGRAWCNIGVTLMALRRVDEAEEALRQACLLDPQNAEAHYNLALTLMLGGQYPEGFREYEWRWKTEFTKGQRQNFSQPLWDGTFLGNKRIFLYAEQGIGDTIQFARYLPLVAKLGGQITLAVPPPLVRLMSWLEERYDVKPPGTPAGGFDTHCPLMSLPLLCGTELDSIPPPATFVIPPSIQNIWAQRVASAKPKVALVWAGNPKHLKNRERSLPLRSLIPLLSVDEVDFFSLQLGPPSQELKAAGCQHRIRDLAPLLTDFAETAAALSCMDLLISVDTAIVHLAGTLQRTVWTLIPFAPDWRWLIGRSDSPWYPSMRLFRQHCQGDWDSVILEVRRALGAWLLDRQQIPLSIPKPVF